MKAVIQRVKSASCTVNGEITGEIGPGLLVFLGVGEGDSASDLDYLVRKITNMRIFSDEDGKFNLSLKDVGGDMLVISQFTLFANTKKGNRPSFIEAAAPEMAENMYEDFCSAVEAEGVHVEKGIFAAMMDIKSINDGPVTIGLNSRL